MRYRNKSTIFITLTMIWACGSDSDDPRDPIDPLLVDTESGQVQGIEIGATQAFLGIPYAAPPVGPLRWKSPQPPAPWAEPLDASAVGSVCPQNDFLGQPVAGGDEDCLTLNVWAPSQPADASHPVMVWIHGGSFTGGSGHGGGTYSGEHLSTAGDVVVVTINYRLGALGFLAHPALGAEDSARPTSGNYGLEDQQLALRWVRDNIAAFGGDPDKVTIFGESAGGMSVCSHLVAPESAGLFHGAIMQSGPCGYLHTTLAQAESHGEALAADIGCDDPAEVLTCLRNASVDALLGFSPAVMLMALGYGPVIDGALVPDAPAEMLAQGKAADVPVLLGANKDEGTIFVFAGGLGTIDEAGYTTFLDMLWTPRGIDPATVAAEYVVADYAAPALALADTAGDGLFVCPARRDAHALAAGNATIYLYHFSREKRPPGESQLGATHGDELAFVFGTDSDLSADDQTLSQAIMGYWTRFAHTGDPNGSDSAAVPWPAYNTAGDEHLDLDLTITAGQNLRADRCDLWDSLQ